MVNIPINILDIKYQLIKGSKIKFRNYLILRNKEKITEKRIQKNCIDRSKGQKIKTYKGKLCLFRIQLSYF
ncbi:hypothetical protein BpHYR1_029608 [Brachionus plicatilis]|uniref:Uncharacterized protein n=1 Tax=Brachionus plicatilis TaxID=10195 RepID=A0A3M7RQB8_BRAPC|nr:hypothetical protein BpHYR1_029608 [Brachionus plicatilis]